MIIADSGREAPAEGYMLRERLLAGWLGLDPGLLTMYTYIMDRTQIYLSREQAAALDREAKRTGTTRSHLIREAIEARYGAHRDAEEAREALKATAGLWSRRSETGEAYVERVRTGRRLRELYAEDDEAKARR